MIYPIGIEGDPVVLDVASSCQVPPAGELRRIGRTIAGKIQVAGETCVDSLIIRRVRGCAVDARPWRVNRHNIAVEVEPLRAELVRTKVAERDQGDGLLRCVPS